MKHLRLVVRLTLLAMVVLPVAACGATGPPPPKPGAATGALGSTATSGPQGPVPTAPAPVSPAPPTTPAPAGPTPPPSSPGNGSTGVANGVMRTVKVGDVTMSALMGVGFSQFPVGDGIRRKDGLVVEYTLVNHGQRSLAVYDLVPLDLGSAALPEINPEHAWVYMHDRSLRVSKQGFDPAPGVNYAAAPVIGIRSLLPGASLTGRAWVPSPPKLDLPGKNFASPGGRGLALDIFTWQFCVQVGDSGRPAGPVTDQSPGPLMAPATSPGPGELLCTDPGPLPAA